MYENSALINAARRVCTTAANTNGLGCNDQVGTAGNTAFFGIYNTSPQAYSANQSAIVYGTTLMIGDQQPAQPPTVTGLPTGWTKTVPTSFNVASTQDGIGIMAFGVWFPAGGPPGRSVYSVTCNKAYQAPYAPCPQTANVNVPITGDLADGVHTIVTDATTPARGGPTATTTLKVDRAAPVAEYTGPFVTQADSSEPFGEDDQYDLWIDAEEITPSAASGVTTVDILVNGTNVHHYVEDCPTGGCDLDDHWSFDPTTYTGPPDPTVTARITDGAGNQTSRSFSIHVVAADQPSYTETEPSPTPHERAETVPANAEACMADPADTLENAALLVTGSWSGGRETTTYFGADEYVVDRCNTLNVFMESQHVASVPVPGGVTARLTVSQTRRLDDGGLQSGFLVYPSPTDPAWMTNWTQTATATLARVLAPTRISGAEPQVAERSSTAHSVSSNPRCNGGDFNTTKNRASWPDDEMNYEINPANNPNPRARTTRRLLDGARTWNQTLDACRQRKRDSFHFVAESTSSSRSVANHSDGKNVVAFSAGRIADRDCDFGGVDALACAVVKRHTGIGLGAGRIEEADIVFDARYSWHTRLSMDACLGATDDRYDVWGVAVHEFGHALGLEHIRDGRSVMYPGAAVCDNDNRILGLGDVRGVRHLY